MKKVFFLLLILGLSVGACKMAVESIEILDGDFEFPKLLSLSAMDGGDWNLEFSKPVSVASLDCYRIDGETIPRFETGLTLKGGNNTETEFSYSQVDEKNISVTIPGGKDVPVVEKYGIDGTVKDPNGNSMRFCGTLKRISTPPPKFILNEMQLSKKGEKFKFVELKVLEDGNMAGAALLWAGRSKDAIRYEFDDMPVQKGDIILIHVLPKKFPDEVPLDETGRGKNNCKSVGAVDGAWDLWVREEAFALSKSGILVAEERSCGKMIDAILIADKTLDEWNTRIQEDIAKKAFSQGVWQGGCKPQHAFDSAKLKSGGDGLTRIGDGCGELAWARVTNSKLSPGL